MAVENFNIEVDNNQTSSGKPLQNVSDSFVRDGENYIYPEKLEKWKSDVAQILQTENGAKLMSVVLSCMRELDDGLTVEEARDTLESGLVNSNIPDELESARNFILDYSKRGPEFEEYIISFNPEEVSPLRQEKINEILAQNAEYELNSAKRGENLEKKTREQEEENIKKNSYMYGALKGRIKEVDEQIAHYTKMKTANDPSIDEKV